MAIPDPEICGIGVDILELERVRKIPDLRRFAEYFLNHSELKELARQTDPVRFVASRFSAKEAVIKAFPGFLRPHEFEIRKNGVKPVVHFITAAGARYKAAISISHSTHYVVGYAAIMNHRT